MIRCVLSSFRIAAVISIRKKSNIFLATLILLCCILCVYSYYGSVEMAAMLHSDIASELVWSIFKIANPVGLVLSSISVFTMLLLQIKENKMERTLFRVIGFSKTQVFIIAVAEIVIVSAPGILAAIVMICIK